MGGKRRTVIFGHASDKAKIKAAHEHPLSRQFDAGRRSMVLHQHKVRLMNHRASCPVPDAFLNLHMRRLRPQAQNALADQCRKLTPSVQKPEAEFELDRGPIDHRRIYGTGMQTVFGTSRFDQADLPETTATWTRASPEHRIAHKTKTRRTAAGFCETRSSAVRSPFSNPWQRGRRFSCSP